MNEGYKVYSGLSAAQRESRLLRSGIEATLSSAKQILSRKKGTKTSIQTQRNQTSDERTRLADTYGAPSFEKAHKQCYNILVYNLNVLQITPLGAGLGMRAALDVFSGALNEDRLDNSESMSSASGEWRGVMKLLQRIAVRTLYSLGLDSGEVLLRAMGNRRYVVERVTPLLQSSGKSLPEPYRSAALALERNLALEQPGRSGLLMGMDPEFIILRESTGRVVPASRYLPTDGVAGCDAGPPGTRGVFPVAELRPQPRGEPRALLAQLLSAAATADRLIADRTLRWRAGGMPLTGWALGGHLHFSGVTLTAPLLRALDNYLALPMLLLEDVRAGARRPRYGVLGDFRTQPHGGFEYRTLPSFLVSPVIAKGAVYLAHLIVSHYEDLTLRPLDREDLHIAYYCGDKSPLRDAVPPLLAQLRALGGYEMAAQHIEPLFQYIAAERTWDESRDIRELWCSKVKG
ncbi:putative amidoligase domain-containing protein [Paenibacillus sp. FSL R5-0345]|uniref:putative amidoligase domain-containing protein n=1 Tax=Paenibacillus sp. FSL R5-0345 TaxID=1536770 RepID=UPI0018CE15F5|nr:hypothetical protein [Paenibacillus sp. FSL R5-0345]